MSHFTVVACLPPDVIAINEVGEALTELMARWDENRAVERYRSYEEGAADCYWLVDSLREEGKLPAEGELTWAQVAAAVNERHGYGKEVANSDDDSDSETMRVDDEGRAFTWSTRNPDAKWDWWVIGGRWRNKFHAKQGVGASALVIGEVSKYDDRVIEKFAPNSGLRCDGGPRGLLDFESMRTEAETKAFALFDTWAKATEGLPPVRPWSEFYGAFQAGETTIEQARNAYHDQPAIKAAGRVEELKWIDNLAQFNVGRDAYAAAARADEVSGYALIDLDGEWIEPGRMGWWGVSHADDASRATYKAKADTYLEALDPETVLVLLDCHI